MFQINDQLLIDVGLGAMPECDKPAFLQHLYETLELRVGKRLSDGLSDEQCEEFSRIIDQDAETIMSWIEQHAPDFPSDPLYQRMRQALSSTSDEGAVVCEYAATKWLEVNRSDYRDVVAAELKTLKAEVAAQATEILAHHGDPALLASDGPATRSGNR